MIRGTNRERLSPVLLGLALTWSSLLCLSSSLAHGATISGSVTDAATGQGTVAGRVTDSLDGSPIHLARVVAVDRQGNLIRAAATGASGAYLLPDLSPGTYFVAVRNATGYVPEVYDDIACSACDDVDGTTVQVVDGETTSGIDFALDPPSVMTGTVTEELTGQPISRITVTAHKVGEAFEMTGITGPGGRYQLKGLVRGTYVVGTSGRFGFLPEIYDDQPCTTSVADPACDPGTGTPVVVAARSTASDVDFALVQGGRISGMITDSVNGAAIPTVTVRATNLEGTWSRQARADRGRYRIDELAEGTYTVETESDFGYLEELFDDVACDSEVLTDCDRSRGTPLSVTLGTELAGIDIDLDMVRGVRGRITSESTGLPIPGVGVALFGPAIGGLITESNGQGYYAVGVTPGRYVALTINHLGFIDEIYDDISCPDGLNQGSCFLRRATPIRIDDSTVHDGVDFALTEFTCTPSLEALCLNGGRFEIRVGWRDSRGNAGAGRASLLSPDTGYFWFFEQTNVELVVKLLDGCEQGTGGAFWFFAAGLTDVATEITVTDTLTGDVKTYSKPLGAAFEPIIDTRAFATCSAARRRAAVQAPPEELTSRGTSAPDELPLLFGRFLVRADWRTPNGQTGSARAEQLTNKVGYFWFFGPNNIEIVVKLLDACDVDPFNNFWFFAAGLTTVEVTLRVTDTKTGQVKKYFNPSNAPFRPVLDTAAFDTCD